MRRAMTGLRLVLAAVVVMLLGIAPVLAGDGPGPAIPKAKGERCVEDTNLMRRDHMELLKHQRDATMRDGIRTKGHSLKECFTCHVVNGSDGNPVTIASDKHFCNACHSYAAVGPDCFACHASTPDGAGPAGAAH